MSRAEVLSTSRVHPPAVLSASAMPWSPIEVASQSPISSENVIVFAVGVLLGLIPWLLSRRRRQTQTSSGFPPPLASISIEKSAAPLLAIRLNDDEILARNAAAHRLLEPFAADRASALCSQISRAVALETSPAFQMTLSTEEGRSVHVEVRASPAEWNGTRCAIATIRDVTRQMELERALAAAQETISTAFDGAPGPIFICDDDRGTILAANRAAASLFGSLNDTGVWTQLASHPIIRMTRDDGHEVQLRVESRRGTFDGRPCVVRFCTALHETTPNLVDQMLEAVLVIDPESRAVIAFNQAACDLYGYPPEQLRGLSTDKITIDPQGCRQICQSVLDAGPLRREIRYHRRANGDMIAVEANFSPAICDGRMTVLCSMQQVVGKANPLTLDETEAPRPASTEFSAKEPKPLVSMPGLILVVDDEPMVREVTRRMLETVGWKTATAPDGHQALQLLHGEPAISAVILDVTMPGMNGLELCRLIRGVRPSLPVVLCSGYGSDAIAHDLLAAQPPLHFVHKPFTMETLLSTVDAAVHPRLAPSHASLARSPDASSHVEGR